MRSTQAMHFSGLRALHRGRPGAAGQALHPAARCVHPAACFRVARAGKPPRLCIPTPERRLTSGSRVQRRELVTVRAISVEPDPDDDDDEEDGGLEAQLRSRACHPRRPLQCCAAGWQGAVGGQCSLDSAVQDIPAVQMTWAMGWRQASRSTPTMRGFARGASPPGRPTCSRTWTA